MSQGSSMDIWAKNGGGGGSLELELQGSTAY